MIVVDSSVWIDFFRRSDTAGVRSLNEISKPSMIIVGDVVLLEVLRGARDDANALRIERILRQFDQAPFLNADLAVQAAKNYRILRAKGGTVRRSADMIIGTFCIEHGHSLLHNDRDFDPMVEHLGLRVI